MPLVDSGTQSVRQGLIFLSPLILYPVIDFVFRIANGLIAPDLRSSFNLNAAELGFVSSTFFIAFGLSQLPLGLILDRYGPKAVTSLLLITACVGALLFISAESMSGLILGRVLMGIGMSASLIAGIKTASIWLPGRLPLATSLLIGATGIGGMFATMPFGAMLEELGWRPAFVILTAATGIIMLATLLIVPTASIDHKSSLRQQISSFGTIFRSVKLWQYAPIAMTCVGVGSAYQTLWAPLWLRDVAGYSNTAIAWVLFVMMGAYACGNFAFGWVAQQRKRRGKSVMPLIVGGVAILIAMQIGLAAQITALAIPLWIGVSIFLSASYAIYPLVTENFDASFAARTSSALNFLVFLSVFFIQWLIGIVIELFPLADKGGFSSTAHSWAFAIGIAIQILGLTWYGASLRRG